MNIITTWDYRLVALSVIIAIVGSYVALDCAGRMKSVTSPVARRLWFVSGALMMGLAIWTMHFVGMEALNMYMPISYDLGLTVLSAFAAMLGAGIAFAIMSRKKLTLFHSLTGSIAMGLAIVTMHYLGMASMQMAARVYYDPGLFALSVLIAIAASGGALWLTFSLEPDKPRLWMLQKTGGAVVMGLAIAGMHYTGMAAASYEHLAIVAPAILPESTVGDIRLRSLLMDAGILFGVALLLLSGKLTAEWQQMNAELRASEEKYRQLVEGVQDYAIFSLNLQGEITTWNEGGKKMFGYDAEEVLGKHFSILFPPDFLEEKSPDEMLARAAEKGRVLYEARKARKGSKLFLAEVTITALQDESGHLKGFANIARDVSLRKQMEVRNRTILETSLDAVIIMDGQGLIREWNLAAEKIFGYSKEKAIGAPLADLIIPFRDREKHRRGLARYCETGEGPLLNHRVEITALRAGGEEFPIELSVIPIPDESTALFVGTVRDITKTKKTMQALRESEERFRSLADSFPAIIYLGDINTPADMISYEPSYVNKAYINILGQAITAAEWQERIHPEDREAVLRMLSEHVPKFQPYSGEFRMRDVHDEYRWLFVTGTPRLLDDGTCAGYTGLAIDITERKNAMDALAESESRFRLMADSSPAIIYLTDEVLDNIYVNKTYREYTGLDPLGSQWQSVIHPDDLSGYLKAVNQGIQQGENYSAEVRMLGKDGEYSWMLSTGAPRYLANGKFMGYTGIAIDITERKKAVEALAESEERFRRLADTAPLMIWLIDKNGKAEHFNKSCLDFTGTTLDTELEGGWVQNVHPDDKWICEESFQTALATRKPFRTETRVRRHDGQYRWVLTEGVPRYDSQGRFEGLIGTCLDIHDLKMSEQAIRQSEAKFRWLSDSNLIGISFWNINGSVNEANDAFLEILGYTRDDLEQGGIQWVNMIPPEIPFTPQDVLERSLQGQSIPSQEVQLVRKDGRRIDTLTGYSMVEGSHEKGIAFILDITERKEAIQLLAKTESHFLRSIADTVPALIWMAGPDGANTYFNRQWHEFTGQYAEVEDWLEVVYPEDREGIQKKYSRSVSLRQGFEMEYRMRRADGAYRWVINRGSPRLDDYGRFLGYIGSILDITERREAREELERLVSERTTQLESVNHELEAFSYSVSHDLRSPLRAIDGFSQAILEMYASQLDERGRDYLTRIRQGSQQMGYLIDDLLKLSRLTRGEMNLTEGIDLSRMAWDAIARLQAEEPGRQVVFEVEDNLVTDGDPRLVQVVLDNMIGNAWKYTSKHATAHIKVGQLKNGATIFYIQDDGAGFDMAYASKLFGAFQRLHTTAEFPGTGIGLATAARIIHRHGGEIWADAEVEKGATFYFTLEAVNTKELQHVSRPGAVHPVG